MNNEEALELIHQNGIGQNVECFFSSENARTQRDYMSLVNHYKYHNGILNNIEIDKSHFLEHEKNLTSLPDCELLIKRKDHGQIETVTLFCKFLEVKNQRIVARVFCYKYFDAGKEIRHKVQIGG